MAQATGKDRSVNVLLILAVSFYVASMVGSMAIEFLGDQLALPAKTQVVAVLVAVVLAAIAIMIYGHIKGGQATARIVYNRAEMDEIVKVARSLGLEPIMLGVAILFVLFAAVVGEVGGCHVGGRTHSGISEAGCLTAVIITVHKGPARPM